jgi:NAD(P)-dependent dehydrogenase (short-subunit alcohol dehydrogenase family)
MRTYALTGGATGIGAAIKARLEAKGHRVIMVDLKDADIMANLATSEGRATAVEGIKAAAPQGLDGLITSAGVGSHIPDHRLIASVNYFGSVKVVEELVDLIALKRGSIVLLSSNSAPMSTSERYVDLLLEGNETEALDESEKISGHEAYSGSKKAIAKWMRRNAPAFARRGATINAIAPGYTETPMTKVVSDDAQYGESIKRFKESIPIGRAGEPEEIAALVDFLVGGESEFICGSVIFIDGGHDAMLRADEF